MVQRVLKQLLVALNSSQAEHLVRSWYRHCSTFRFYCWLIPLAPNVYNLTEMLTVCFAVLVVEKIAVVPQGSSSLVSKRVLKSATTERSSACTNISCALHQSCNFHELCSKDVLARSLVSYHHNHKVVSLIAVLHKWQCTNGVLHNYNAGGIGNAFPAASIASFPSLRMSTSLHNFFLFASQGFWRKKQQ